MAAPLNNGNFENLFFMLPGVQKETLSQIVMSIRLQMSKITPENRKWANFNTEGNGQPPLKMEILKIRFFFMLPGVQK